MIAKRARCIADGGMAPSRPVTFGGAWLSGAMSRGVASRKRPARHASTVFNPNLLYVSLSQRVVSKSFTNDSRPPAFVMSIGLCSVSLHGVSMPPAHVSMFCVSSSSCPKATSPHLTSTEVTAVVAAFCTPSRYSGGQHALLPAGHAAE